MCAYEKYYVWITIISEAIPKTHVILNLGLLGDLTLGSDVINEGLGSYGVTHMFQRVTNRWTCPTLRTVHLPRYNRWLK